MTRKTVNVAYGQICIRTSQEVIDKSDALIPRLALLDGLQRSVARSDPFCSYRTEHREANQVGERLTDAITRFKATIKEKP